MWILFGLPALAVMWFYALRHYPVRTLAVAHGGFGVFLLAGTAWAVLAGDVTIGFNISLLWIALVVALILDIRPLKLRQVHDVSSFAESLKMAAESGYSEFRAFRYRPELPHTLLLFRRSADPTVLAIVHRDGHEQPRRWWFSTVIGGREGVLITSPGSSGMVSLREIRQIVTRPNIGAEMHEDALELLNEMGINTAEQIGNGYEDHLLWAHGIDRQTVRRNPLSFMMMWFRPPLHIGPLRTRRRAKKQLRRFMR